MVSTTISRILSGRFLGRDDHLSLPDFSESPADFHSPWCDDTRGLNGPAALPLFCLAPHGVFPASRITPRAVSSYLAFSPLPALLSKNRRYLFCDTLRQPQLWSGPPTSSTWHAAVWCSDFPPVNLQLHQRSSPIAGKSVTLRKTG